MRCFFKVVRWVSWYIFGVDVKITRKYHIVGIRIKSVHNHRKGYHMAKVGDVKALKVVAFDTAGLDLPSDALKDATLTWSADGGATLDTASGELVSVSFGAPGNVTVSVSASWPSGAFASAGISFVVDEPLAGPPEGFSGIKITEA